MNKSEARNSNFLQKAPAGAFYVGAGDGNRTHVYSLENYRTTIVLHPHVGMPRFELGPNAPKALMLPLHHIPIF